MSLFLERNLSHYLSVLAICILTRYSSGELDGEFAAGVRGSSAHVTRHLGPAELCHEDWMQLKEKMQQAKGCAASSWDIRASFWGAEGENCNIWEFVECY